MDPLCCNARVPEDPADHVLRIAKVSLKTVACPRRYKARLGVSFYSDSLAIVQFVSTVGSVANL